MLMILTLAGRPNAFPDIQSNAWSAHHEPRAAVGGPRDDPAARLCGHGGLRARHRAVRRPEGHAAASDGRLDLGRPDGRRRGQLVLIHEIRLLGPWSPIHLLSIFTLIVLPIAVWRARRHKVADHRRIMIMIFVGALVIAGLFTFLPGRIM